MEKTFTILGALFMILAVAAGAFGTHTLSDTFAAHPALEKTYATAVRYHMFHALALLAAAWASSRWPGAWTTAAGWLFVAGILLFSGALYVLTLTGQRWLGTIAPLGGLALLAGWLALALAAWRG